MSEKKLSAEIGKMSPEEKKQLAKKIGQDAYDNEMQYHGCSQSTLAALLKHLNLENPAVFKSTSGLAGGVGRTGEGTCGALSAGVTAISLIYGRDKLESAMESAGYAEAMRRSGILCNKFAEQFGSLKCHDVQRKISGRDWNLNDEKERLEFISVMTPACSDVCRKTAEFATEVILEPTPTG